MEIIKAVMHSTQIGENGELVAVPVSTANPLFVSQGSSGGPTLAVSQENATVTNAAASFILTFGVYDYILIKNNDLVGTIFIRFNDDAGAGDLAIQPGGSYELQAHTQCFITAIGSIASNTLITVLHGAYAE